MAPVLEGAGAQTVDIELDSAGSLDLPPGEPGWLTLSLSVAGTQVASVVAPEPGAQWDWPALTARVVEACASGVGPDALDDLERLGDGASEDGQLRVS